VLSNPFSKEVFPDTQPKRTLAQLKAISPRPVTCHQRVETNPALAVSTFQILEEGKKISPQPPLPQTKQPQFLQSLFVGQLRNEVLLFLTWGGFLRVFMMWHAMK